MWEVLMYEKSDGSVPTQAFLESIQDFKLRAKLLREIDLLEEFGQELRKPHTEPISDPRGAMFELRVQQSSDIARVFFFYIKDKNIILLNGFVKKTRKTPPIEINKAFQYIADYLARGETNEK